MRASATETDGDGCPALKIYTLGRFAVVRDGEVATQARASKTPVKPLSLLKALIALGGRNVSEQALCDALWGQQDGDAAHRDCATTLSRLRRFLQCRDAIQMQQGQLTLNSKVCWVDVWEFERLVSEVRTELHARQPDIDHLLELHHRIDALYQGAFLGLEEDTAAYLPLRARLRARYLQHIEGLARELGRVGHCEWVVQAYERAVQVDSCAEHFYRQLMVCHAALGRRSTALQRYRECRDALRQFMDIEPADETDTLFRALCAGDMTIPADRCRLCSHGYWRVSPYRS